MTKILVNSQGKALLTGSGKPLTKVSGGGGHTGTVDTVGLTALGWDSYDIQWLQDHVWWDAADNAYWAVSAANLAFGPGGATPLTWATRSTIQNNANVRYLPKLTLPANTSNLSMAFMNYAYLWAIPTHGWDVSNVTTFGYMFANCFSLCSVGDLSGWVTSKCTAINQMFYVCYCLRNIGDISGWNVTNVTTFLRVFSSCYVLKSIGDLSNWGTGKVTTFQEMFGGCYQLDNIGDLSNWDTGMVTNFSNLFADCQSMSVLIGLGAWDTTAVNSINNCFGKLFCLSKIDLSSWDLSLCANVGTSASNSIFNNLYNTNIITLGPKFFNFQSTTLFANNCQAWTRDSVYESLYTNQTLRDSNSVAKTVNLYSRVYDSLSAQDISDIATKNITIARV